MRRRFAAVAAVALAALLLHLRAAHRPERAPSAGRETEPSARAVERPTLAMTDRAEAPIRGLRILRTPGCGTNPRELTLPERELVPVEQQAAVRDTLEVLRERIAERVPVRDSTSPEDVDLIRNDGSIAELRMRWSELPAARRAAILQGEDDPFVDDLVAIAAATAEARTELGEELGEELATQLWFETLSMCQLELQS